MVPAALRRCGRFADGWLPSSCTPDEVAAARAGHRRRRRRGRPVDQPRALRGVDRLCLGPLSPNAIRAVASARRGVDPTRWCRWASTGCAPCSRTSSRWDSPSSWSVPWWNRRLVAGGARSAGRRRARPPDMTRSRPAGVRVRGPRRSRAAGPHGRGGRRGTGWINVEPIIEEEHEPPPPGPFAFLGGSTHQVPTVTWMPGQAPGRRHHPADDRRACSTPPGPRGLEAARLRSHPARRVAGHPGPSPPGTGGHGAPRRRHRAVMDWLLRLAAAVCTVPTTGRWEASVHLGRP